MTIEPLPLGFPHTTTRFSRGKTQRSELSNGQFSALVILRVSAALDKDGPGLVLETFPLSSARTSTLLVFTGCSSSVSLARSSENVLEL